jgi:hypothetical protein
MRASVLFVMLAASTIGAAPQSPGDEAVQHAAQTVAHLRDTMLDPASFVLDAVYITKPIHRFADKDHKDKATYCYAFRSHNSMGGYAEGRAYEDPLDRGRLEVVTPNEDGAFSGYDAGMTAPCKTKNIDHDITADVVTLAPPLYRKTK